jgi:hypothetical protein
MEIDADLIVFLFMMGGVFYTSLFIVAFLWTVRTILWFLWDLGVRVFSRRDGERGQPR